MALSSLSVVTNANRLRRYHPAPLAAAETVTVEPLVHTGGERHAAHGHGYTRHGDDGTTGEAVVTDPVCGMRVDPATAAEHRQTEASTVYFCSPGCAAAFDAAPERYAAAAAGPVPGEAAA